MSTQTPSKGDGDLIPADFLVTLTEDQREEALAAARAAKRAEERAEQRAIEKALRVKEEARRLEREQAPQQQQQQLQRRAAASQVVFRSKKQREADAAKAALNDDKPAVAARPSKSAPLGQEPAYQSAWNDKQRTAIQKSYLGKRSIKKTEEETLKQRRKERAKKKITFNFQWDNAEDTLQDDDDLYAGMVAKPKKAANKQRVVMEDLPSNTVSIHTVKNKPLHQMTKRDWSIFRENFDIVVKGGKTPPPLRTFTESPTN